MSWLLERLRKFQDNRGMMANLRCVLVDNKKHRAWPALNRLGLEINNDVSAYVAGLYATHPDVTDTGNFGATCRAIMDRRDDRREDDEKLSPTERRFQQLLAADGGSELFNRILRMVLMAKAQGVPINYEKLEADLKYKILTDRTKTEWATSFWAQGVEPATEEGV